MEPTSRPAMTFGIGHVDDGQLHRLAERREQRQGRQRGRTDGEALADGGGGVAHRVELVGALAHFLLEVGHFRQAAGVVGDRPVGVDRQLDARGGQHAQAAEGDAVEAREVVAGDDRRRASTSTGAAVEIMPTPRPAMMLVAAPVSEASATLLEGPLPSAV